MIEVDIHNQMIGPFRIGQSFTIAGALLDELRPRLGASRRIELQLGKGAEVDASIELDGATARCQFRRGIAGKPGDALLLGVPLSQWTLTGLRARLADLGLRAEHEEDCWVYISNGSMLDVFGEEVCSIIFDARLDRLPGPRLIINDIETIHAFADAAEQGDGGELNGA